MICTRTKPSRDERGGFGVFEGSSGVAASGETYYAKKALPIFALILRFFDEALNFVFDDWNDNKYRGA